MSEQTTDHEENENESKQTTNTDEQASDQSERAIEKDKLFREKNNWKNKALEHEAELKLLKEERLKANNQYKELYDSSLEENKSLKATLQDYNTREEKSMKLSTIKGELKKMGLRDDRIDTALRIADIDNVKYDPENKLVLGAEEVARRVKEVSPEWFGKSSSSAGHNAPDINAGGWTKEKFGALSSADKKTHYADYAKSLGLDFKA